jgi:hypothetical protein
VIEELAQQPPSALAEHPRAADPAGRRLEALPRSRPTGSTRRAARGSRARATRWPGGSTLLAAWEALLDRLGGPADPEFVDWLAVDRSDAREFDVGDPPPLARSDEALRPRGAGTGARRAADQRDPDRRHGQTDDVGQRDRPQRRGAYRGRQPLLSAAKARSITPAAPKC